MPNHDPQPLEQFVHRALRELPTERAPAALEARVLATLQARQRRVVGWRAWPAVPRTVVLAAAAATAFVVVWAFFVGTRTFATVDWSGWIDHHAPWLAVGGSLLDSLAGTIGLCVRKFQPWLVGLAVLAAGSYVALIALGSGLYRRLHLNR